MSADIIQHLRGHGAIYRDGERVGEADYELTITPAGAQGSPETPDATTDADHPSEGSPAITGRLLGNFFEAESFADGVHTLQLADGREVDFRVLQPDTNEIVGVSWFH